MLGIGKEYVNWRRLCRPPFSYRQKNVSLNKLFIFTPMGMCRKGTAYIPVDTLDDW